MDVIFTIIFVSTLVQQYAAEDLQNIQTPNPVQVDLSNLSEVTAVVSNGDTRIDEHKLGGYRPLYPPYFLRDTAAQAATGPPQNTYYDKEYYSRGAQPGGVDDRLDRFLRIRTTPAPLMLAAVIPTSAIPLRQNSVRTFSNYNFKTEYANSASWNVKSTYSFRNFRFPVA